MSGRGLTFSQLFLQTLILCYIGNKYGLLSNFLLKNIRLVILRVELYIYFEVKSH